MINSIQSSAAPLSLFFRKLAVAPNVRVVQELFNRLQSKPFEELNLDSWKPSSEETRLFQLAKKKISQWSEIPEELQFLMHRVQEIIYKSLNVDPVLMKHLQEIVGENFLDLSLVDNYLSAAALTKSWVSYSDLFYLLGSDWGFKTGAAAHTFQKDYHHSFKLFYELIFSAANANLTTQSEFWNANKLTDHLEKIVVLVEVAKEGKLNPPSEELLKEIQETGQTIYVPVGNFDHDYFFVSLIAIDFINDQYRLRLLAADNSNIFALNDKPDHYCPEVVWEGVKLEQLTSPALWEPLFEVATLREGELRSPIGHRADKSFLAFDSEHLIPWLCLQLGMRPYSYEVKVDDSVWASLKDNRWRGSSYQMIMKDWTPQSKPVSAGNMMLAATRRSNKQTLNLEFLRKFVNLIPKDVILQKSNQLLFKAESRLLLLVSAFASLQKGAVPLSIQGHFIRLIEQSYGKVTAPIEKLMQSTHFDKTKEAASILLATLFDLKQRLTSFVHAADRISLVAPHALYPSTHTLQRLTLSGAYWSPMEHTLFDMLRVHNNPEPLAMHTKWTAENWPEIYASLEQWYDVLLDAKHKCEPAEIIMMAHRNVFSRLPIPSSDKIYDTFPEPISEGLLVGTLLLLKKIGSLVTAETYQDHFVPPLVVADLTRLYRFAYELLCFINPSVRKMTVSWFSLYRYMDSRHSFHAPGEVYETLQKLVNSFKLISPKGHEHHLIEKGSIPLFYFSWDKVATGVKIYIKDLEPEDGGTKNVGEVLAVAELADSVGIKIEDTEGHRADNAVKWENSFGGQTLLAVKEIAQYSTLAIFATTNGFRDTINRKNYDFLQQGHIGPEDHLPLGPDQVSTLFGSHSFGMHFKPEKEVYDGVIPMTQRMVQCENENIRGAISNLPIRRVTEWREQADLLKSMPKRNVFQGTYHLNQIASGPSSLSIDLLLEYFESHTNLLFNQDYRSYFWGIIRSAHILEKSLKREPHLLYRLKSFINAIYEEDRTHLQESQLHFDRMLWISAVCRHIIPISRDERDELGPLLQKIMNELWENAHGTVAEVQLAPHLLATAHLLGNVFVSTPELARLHLIVGRNPPNDAYDAILRLEVYEAMQYHAREIQHVLLHGIKSKQRAIWSLILQSEAEIQEVLERPRHNLSIDTLAKTSAESVRLKMKQAYFEKYQEKAKQRYEREITWRDAATSKVLEKVQSTLSVITSVVVVERNKILNKAQQLLCATATSLIVQIGGRIIGVDWETGRIFGAGNNINSGSRLPIFLRKHPDLAPLKKLLDRPVHESEENNHVKFLGEESISLDISAGSAWLDFDGRPYRLIPPDKYDSVQLTSQFKTGFSIWISLDETALTRAVIVAHDAKGTPTPAFQVDNEGCIRMITGNPNFRLATSDYYPESEIFKRWGLLQENILVWLDENHRVSELHIPLNNGVDHFTRIIKMPNGSWKLYGLDIDLIETDHAVSAFAGHPVYLCARNADGQPLLILSGANPYQVQNRKELQKHTVDWNDIITKGTKEGIHQYRILPDGEVVGLTVADNLLLILWKVYMGHYETAEALMQRWLTPPGRPYTAEEQRILNTWVHHSYEKEATIYDEQHPSASVLRLKALLRMSQHLRDFPPETKEGQKMSKLRAKFFGERSDTFEVRYYTDQKLLKRNMFGRQIGATKFNTSFSPYDQRAVINIVLLEKHKDSLYCRELAKRIKEIPSDIEAGKIKIKTVNFAQMIGNWTHLLDWGGYHYDDIIKNYPVTQQIATVPVKTLYLKVVTTPLLPYFDRAYTLIKLGPQTESDKEEYDAVLFGIKELYGQRAKDLCYRYANRDVGNHIGESIFEENIILWLLLEQAYLAKEKGIELPELPSKQIRFGLVLKGSKKLSQEFFDKLAAFSGIDIKVHYQKYCLEWFERRQFRYFDQEHYYHESSNEFGEDLKKQYSQQLINEIERWKHLDSKLTSEEQIQVDIPRWSYPLPEAWFEIPLDAVGLQRLFQEVVELYNNRLVTKSAREAELLETANLMPEHAGLDPKIYQLAAEMHYTPTVTIDNIIGLALIAQEEAWRKQCPNVDPRLLQAMTLSYLELAIEVKHLENIKKVIEQCLTDPSDKDLRQNLIDLLSNEHHYLPSTKTLPIMASEYYSGCRLRNDPDQAELIRILSETPPGFKGSIIQAIMGSGKSKMIGPIWLQMMLGMGYTPLLCVPSSQRRTAISDLQSMMWDRFRTHVRVLSFERENCTKEYLMSIAETFFYTKERPTVLVCTPRDLYALQLMLKERHQIIDDMRQRLIKYTVIWARSLKNPETLIPFIKQLKKGNWEEAAKKLPETAKKEFEAWSSSHTSLEKELKPILEESSLLQAVLNLLQTKAAILTDEVATVDDPRNLLSFPIGWQEPANPKAYHAAFKIYFKWLPHYYGELGLLENMQSYSTPELRQSIYIGIASMAWNEYKELLPDLPPLEQFTAYLLSDRENGAFMQNYIYRINGKEGAYKRGLAQEIAFLKYALSSGLEGSLTTTAFVNYGRSEQDPGLYLAIPYECSNVPKENTLFRRPWKTVLMTCQYYSQRWVDPQQTAQLMDYLQGIDPESKDQDILEAAVAIWGIRFGNVSSFDKKAVEELTVLLDTARQDPSVAHHARLLIQTYLQACVFPPQLKLDPAQLTSTPQELPHMSAKADAMGGTFGFEATWNTIQQRVPDLSCDEKVLKALAEPRNQQCYKIPRGGAEALLNFLESGEVSGYMALIDVGALFMGINNEVVAKRLLEALPEFDCILFYDEKQQGGARLSVMSPAGKKVLEQSDRDGVRHALSQMKLKKPFAYYDQARRIGADLDLPDGYAWVTFSDKPTKDDILQGTMRCRKLLDGRHSISYLIPGELEGDWIGDRVVETAAYQQEQVEKKANFHGICTQIRGVVQAAIDKKMRSEPDDIKRHAIHKAAAAFMMEKQENDLVKTFGALQGVTASVTAIFRLAEQLVEVIGKILPSEKDAVRKAIDSVLQWHQKRNTPLPDFVRDGEEVDDAVQEVDLSQDQDRLRQMEEEYERMLGARNPKKEIPWKLFDLENISKTRFGMKTRAKGMPTLYSLKDALKERHLPVPFSDNLLISENVLSTFLGETNCLITDNQKPVHRGIFINKGDKKIYALVSEGDARRLKKHLLTSKRKFESYHVYLAEPNGAVNQRGHLDDPVENLWASGSMEVRELLLQGLIFQGAATVIDKFPPQIVAELIKRITKNKPELKMDLRVLFEAVLELRQDEMQYYQRSVKLRKLFC